MSEVDDAAAAILAGLPAIVPTDTVYGLVTTPYREEPVRRLYALKTRDAAQPTALIAADLDTLFVCVPELRGRAGAIAAAVLPGPYTLVLANPARRFPWLAGDNPDAIGVRVPAVSGVARTLLDQVGAVAGTSANLAGGSEARRLSDVAEVLLAECASVDGGELPGIPSSVIDFTGPEAVVLRRGAGDIDDAIARATAAVG
ncbi:MAG TPA: L-threonylcarbamoyladenylate synthase [Gaiellaceae bacterium]|nr:L-threonylcarbamoyladenylate synthase [Gaiellaceae bacterium]